MFLGRNSRFFFLRVSGDRLPVGVYIALDNLQNKIVCFMKPQTGQIFAPVSETSNRENNSGKKEISQFQV